MTAMPENKIPVPPATAPPSPSEKPEGPGYDLAAGNFDLTAAGSEGLMKQLLVFQKFALDQAAIVAITDVRGRIISVNDKFCQISKYPRSELIGQDHRILNSGTHPKQFFKDMYAMIARGKVWHGEIRNRAKDGSFYWVDTTIVPIITNPTQGKISGYIAIRHDITELKNIQERLRIAKEAAEAANQAKGEFLANMSHEIRTPMTAIIGYADLLGDENRRAEDRTEFLQTIRRNGEHLLSVINDILDISKIEAGKLQVENITFDPAKIVSDIEASMRVRAMEKGVGFGVEYRGQVPACLHSDPHAPPAGAAQPRQQRRQVHRRGDDQDRRQLRSARRQDALCHLRYRNRFEPRPAGKSLQAVFTGRRIDGPAVWRDRTGAGALQAPRRSDGGTGHPAKQTGKGKHIRIHRQ